MSPHHHSRALALNAIAHLEPSIIFGNAAAGRIGGNILPSLINEREGEASGSNDRKCNESTGSMLTTTSYRANIPSHRTRHRSSAIVGSAHSLVRGVSSSSTGASTGSVKEKSGRPRRKALVFAGLGSYPHTPSQLTPSSHTIWARASSALLDPHPDMHYTPDGIHPQNINGTGHAGGEVGEEAWLRGWLAGKRGMGEILKEPDLQAAFVLTSNIALLASAQEHNATPTLLPQNTSHLLGYGFIGTLTCLVATDRVKLEDAVRLARLYALLKGPALSRDRDLRQKDPNHKGFLTTLLTLSEDISKTRKHSLSETILPTSTHTSSGENPEQALRHVLGIIDQLQDSQGWDRCFLHDGTYPGAASMDEPVFGTRGGEGEKAVFRGEWAGEAMINSCRSLTLSGTPHAVIKIVDRLRSAGLATPVMDMHIAAPYHTPLMGSAVHNFRRALKGVNFFPKGGANSIARGVGVSGSGEKREGKEEAVVLDGITAQPLPMHDIHASLLSYLVRPLQWHKTTQALYRSQAEGEVPAVSEIQIVGQGGRGLGAHILRDIRAFNQAEGQDTGPEMMDFDAHGAKKPTSGRKSR